MLITTPNNWYFSLHHMSNFMFWCWILWFLGCPLCAQCGVPAQDLLFKARAVCIFWRTLSWMHFAQNIHHRCHLLQLWNRQFSVKIGFQLKRYMRSFTNTMMPFMPIFLNIIIEYRWVKQNGSFDTMKRSYFCQSLKGCFFGSCYADILQVWVMLTIGFVDFRLWSFVRL